MDCWAVVLAGGHGTRFWPQSRRSRPKQCLALDGTRSLLQQTLDRIAPLVPAERTLVITGAAMEAEVRAQCADLPHENVLVEPSARNTAPAIAWAAQEVGRRGGATMIVLPADHRIGDPDGLRSVLSRAVRIAEEDRVLVLLGHHPTRPESGFGYILPSEQRAGSFQVDGFVEKPDRAAAEALIARGALWNCGIFVWTVAAIREAIAIHLPATAAALDGDDWSTTDAISIDHMFIRSE